MKTRTTAAAIIVTLSFSSLAFAMPDMKPPAATEEVNAKPIAGKVLETMNSSGYTYMLLDIDGFKDWVAIPEMYVEVGDEVELVAGVQMGEQTSKTLKKTFKQIIYSSGPTTKYNEKRKANAHKGADMSVAAPGKAKNEGKAIVDDLKVEKAKGANAYDLAEIFAKRAELQDKIISVRGQVIKVTAGVMNRTWVHIKDGTGENGANKLVITTQDSPNTGDVLTFTGVFHNNVDFGGGYQYAVIMEDASAK